MTIQEWLSLQKTKLSAAGVDAPERDALVILEDTLGKERIWVLSHLDARLDPKIVERAKRKVQQRADRDPLAYVRNKAWFYGRQFYVDKNVLIPRPESEQIIDFAKELNPTSLFDIGTGSGCLAISAQLEMPDCKILATDVSEEALTIARKNAREMSAQEIQFKNNYLLENLLHKTTPELIIANLPYVPDNHITSEEIRHEPQLALFAGEQGMDLYQTFWAQLASADNKPAHVITESLETQHSHMSRLAIQSGYTLKKAFHLIQVWVLAN